MNPELISHLEKRLPTRTVTGLSGFPARTFEEFEEAVRAHLLNVRTQFDDQAADAVGGRFEIAYLYVLSLLPWLVSAASVIVALVYGRYWLLVGALWAFLSAFLTSPGVFRVIGAKLTLLSAGLSAVAWYFGSANVALLAGGLFLALFFSGAARFQCSAILERAATQSEIVLIWLWLRRTLAVVTVDKSPKVWMHSPNRADKHNLT